MPNWSKIRSLRRSPSIVLASLASNVLGLALPLVMIQLYDRVIPNKGYATLTVLAVGLGIAIFMDALLKLARGALMAHAGAEYDRQSGARAVRTILNDERNDATSPGILYNEVVQIDRVRQFYTGDAGVALLDVPFIFLFLGVMMWISPQVGFTVMALVVCVFVLVRSMRKQIVKLNDERLERDGRRQSFLIETLGGFESVKALGAEAFMERRYERLMAGSAPTGAAIAAKVQLTQGITGAVGMMGPVITAGVGAYMVILDQLTVGALAAMVLLAGRIVQPALRLEALLIGDEDVRKLEKSLAPLISPPKIFATQNVLTSIETTNAQWSQQVTKAHNGALSELTLQRGDCISINGDESSGRSAFLAAIAGHKVLDNVDVSFNGMRSEGHNANNLAENIAFLNRDASTLSGTLLENLTRFQPARYRAQALQLVDDLGMDTFIARHPKGLDLRIGDGTRGELPAALIDVVHIISALVIDPDVILFDQANAAMDKDTDQRLLALLMRLQPKKAIIIVSERASYQSLANRHYHMVSGALFPLEKAPPLDLERYGSLIA